MEEVAKVHDSRTFGGYLMMGTFQLSSFLGFFFMKIHGLQITDVGHEKKMDLLVQDFVMLPNPWKNTSQTAHLVSGDRNFIRKTFSGFEEFGFQTLGSKSCSSYSCSQTTKLTKDPYL